MKRVFGACLLLVVGVALGRMFDGVPATAATGGGGNVDKCAAKNGDVNADGAVNLSDAVTILGHLFLGSPTELVPLCAAPPAPSGLPTRGSQCEPDRLDPLRSARWGRTAPRDGLSLEGRFVDNDNRSPCGHVAKVRHVNGVLSRTGACLVRPGVART